MADKSVADRVIQVFAEFKKMAVGDISLQTTFEDLGLDSLDGLNLVFELEEEFDIMIPDEKAQSMRSVAEVVSAIEAVLAGDIGEDPQPAAG